MVWAASADLQNNGKKVIALELPKGADERKIEVVDHTPDGGLYFAHGRALCSGRRVHIEHFPQYLKKYGGGAIPDYGNLYRLNYVSDRFKDIVESIEPNLHQFIPFQIIGPKKVVLADMYFMVVCNRLDSVDREETTLILDGGAMWMQHQNVPREDWPPNFNPHRAPRFVFNLSQIGENHLWYDKHSIYGPYLSDALAEALIASPVTGIKLAKQESV